MSMPSVFAPASDAKSLPSGRLIEGGSREGAGGSAILTGWGGLFSGFAVVFELALQRPQSDAQNLRRLRPVALRLLQGAKNRFLLDLLHGAGRTGGHEALLSFLG